MKKPRTVLSNANLMGLEYRDNAYYHSDRYSQICYKELQNVDNQHKVPILGIYTRKDNTKEYKFVGITSYHYLFFGNASIVDSTVNSITESNLPILEEIYNFNGKYTWFSSDIIIRNQNSIPNIGDVYPVINIWNSYDGSKTAEISFGLALNTGSRNYQILSLRSNLGSYKQIHVQGSRTGLSYLIGNYVERLNNNITDLIRMNSENVLNTETILTTLDIIEKIGKRRHDAISSYITELNESNRPVTSWDIFLAVSRYTSSEKNLNARVLLENIVERIMVVPTQMMGLTRPAQAA